MNNSSESEMLSYLAKYCSQAERCLFDLRRKLQTADLSESAEKRIIDYLLREKFIDEQRFCRSFVHDKFYLNHWGRVKIVYELKLRSIQPDDYCEAIEAIDEDAYLAVLIEILTTKKRSIKGQTPQEAYRKLFQFAASKGFEPPLIAKQLKTILKNVDDD